MKQDVEGVCEYYVHYICDFLFWVKGKMKFHPVRLLVCMFPAGRQITKRADGEISEVLKMLEERSQNDGDQPNQKKREKKKKKLFFKCGVFLLCYC